MYEDVQTPMSHKSLPVNGFGVKKYIISQFILVD